MPTRSLVMIALGLAVLAAGAFVPGAAAEEQATEAGSGVVPETLSLERAIEIAIEYNPEVEVSRQGITAAGGQLTRAMSALMPRLTVSARRVTPVDLPPFSFQSHWRGSEGAYRWTCQQIAFAVRESYYRVLTAEQGVTVAQDVVDSAEEHLRVARLRYEAGVVPQFDVLAAEARVARVEQGLISAVAARDIGWANLSTVLGVPIPSGTKLSAPPPVASGEADLEDLREEALANRPDLLTADATRAVAVAALEVARAATRPTVSAGLSYTLRGQTVIAGDLFGVPGQDIVVSQNSGYIVVAANYSLFDGGQAEGEIRTAGANVTQAEKGVEGLEQRIELEVKSAYLLLSAARAQVEAAQKEVAQAQEAHRVATLRYDEGVGTSLEILDAEANLEGARTRLNGATYGLNLAVAQLDLAVGRDWREAIQTDAATEDAGG